MSGLKVLKERMNLSFLAGDPRIGVEEEVYGDHKEGRSQSGGG